MEIYNSISSYTFNKELKGKVIKFRESDLHCELIGVVVEINNEYMNVVGEYGNKCLDANSIILLQGYIKVLDIGGTL